MISGDKLSSFATGKVAKSRFQKAREEKEAKDKEEAAAAAKVYESFVASFASNDDEKTFVRGSDGERYKMNRSGGEKPPLGPPEAVSAKGKSSEMSKLLEEMKALEFLEDLTSTC